MYQEDFTYGPETDEMNGYAGYAEDVEFDDDERYDRKEEAAKSQKSTLKKAPFMSKPLIRPGGVSCGGTAKLKANC